MILTVRIPDGMAYYRRYRGRGEFADFEKTRLLCTTVRRVRRTGSPEWVEVDAWIPERYRASIRATDPRWVEPGVYRTRAAIRGNERTLAPFLGSGDAQWDIPEAA
ncbi:hypothetical protein QS306_14535 [Paraburkholderia bonniea]|uniref:hypothetical protein n=1 Tax=Paraburkholderia bonniea TaxID=2152891 RepID=UPI00129144C2|nr:hypothetical protein [Paraburkholderia bonniea]WJF91986.1 hypothetical protein QS306_14535 [Paraburkholderia bonniea]WJF95305.1 hypothetical protein QS308_14540 [Paraburkholderia bonniea]